MSGPELWLSHRLPPFDLIAKCVVIHRLAREGQSAVDLHLGVRHHRVAVDEFDELLFLLSVQRSLAAGLLLQLNVTGLSIARKPVLDRLEARVSIYFD